MKTERAATTVELTIPDMKAVEQEYIAEHKAKKPTLTGVEIEIIGYVKTPKGFYWLNGEGVGPEGINSDVEVEVYEIHQRKDREGTYRGSFPNAVLAFTTAEIETMPVLGRVNLAKFIRAFGHRLETNYALWRGTIEKAMKKPRSKK